MAFTICYVWEDLDAAKAIGTPEQKFGDHHSEAATLTEAFAETRKYIRGSLRRQKHKFDEGRVVIHQLWDVTDYAKQRNRFGKHQKVDDIIRPVIGGHVQADIHRIDHITLITRVNQELSKCNQALPTVALAAWQARTLEDVLYNVALGKRTIIAELCARFGKTIWSGALVCETNVPLTIIVSYVLTSFASFEKDLSSYEQFKNLVVVDTAVEGYQDTIDTALVNGRQVVAFLSMCMGGKRRQKIDYLFRKDCNRLVIVDEADFGVHKAGQAKPLIEARNDNDVIVLMTGTNADKAAGMWKADHMVSVVYPELLMEKRNPLASYPATLKHFKIDHKRHELVVDVEFYQMPLGSLLDHLKKVDPGAFVDDGIYLASWSKTAANPIKAKGFWTRMLQSVFLGQHGLDDLNVEYQVGEVADHRVAMMFLPGSTTNDNVRVMAKLAKQALPGYLVLPIYGEKMSNREAEKVAKEAIEKARKINQSVLLLSAGMAQRSFSVAEITELYLAYDSGDNSATIQKMSRALTPAQIAKVGRIVSLSFDPNRDDKFDAMLIETALNYKKNHKLSDAKAAMKDVLRTVDIFRCSADGAVKLGADEYLEDAIGRNSVSRVVGKVAELGNLSVDELVAISRGKAEVFRAAKVLAAEKGKTRIAAKGKANGAKVPCGEMATAKLVAQVREVIVTIAQNLDIIRYQGGSTLDEAFAILDQGPQSTRDGISEDFGVDYELIKALVFDGVINRDLLDLEFKD